MRIGRYSLALMAAFAAAAPYAGAQEVVRTDTSRGLRILPALGLRAGTPQKVSVALGVIAGNDRVFRRDAIALYVEPGIAAGRGTLAYVNGFGNMGRGFGIGATALRTWKDPLTLQPNRTYAGGEIWIWPLFYVGPRVGLFRQVSGPGTRGWYFTADFGIGL